MIISQNIAALRISDQLNKDQKRVADSMEKLASGKRIQTASDDAAGMMISLRTKARASSLSKAQQNIDDGVSLVQTAEKGLGTIANPLLLRMRGLAVQAASGTLDESDRSAIQEELDELTQQITHIAKGTTFNGIPLLNAAGSNGALGITYLQTGADATERFPVQLSDVRAKALGLDPLLVTPRDEALQAIAKIDTALQTVTTERARFGAYSNTLDSMRHVAEEYETNLLQTVSHIADTDMAKEMAELTKNKMLTEVSQNMLSQAHKQPENVLQLLKS